VRRSGRGWQFRLELEHFVRRGDQILAAAAQDMGQIMPQA